MNNTQSDVLMDLRERMVRIETKLDTHAENRTADKAQADDQERRLSNLESAYKVMASVGAIMLFLITFFQERITSLFA